MGSFKKRRVCLVLAFLAFVSVLILPQVKKAQAAEKRLVSLTAVYTGGTVLVNHSIDLEKLTVMGLYSDGSYEKIKDYSLSAYGITESGTNLITVSYEGVNTYFTVQGKSVLILSAYYEQASVTVGEQLDRDKISVYAYYSDGTNERLTNYTLASTAVTKIGTNDFYVIYEGKTAKFSVTGKEIRLAKTLYADYFGPAVIVGNTPRREDFYVTVMYNDNSIEKITTFELTPSVVQKAGSNTVVVSYGTLSKEVKIEGLPKEVVSIKAEYTGLPVVIGKTVATEDIKVTATFNDQTKDTVTNFTLSSSVIYTIGDNLLTVFCGEAVAYITVRGVEAEIIDYGNAAKEIVKSGDISSRVTVAVNKKADPEQVLIQSVNGKLVQKAMRRIVRSDLYLAFEIAFEDPNMDVFLPMTVKVTVPDLFDKDNFAVFYTPNRKTIMAQMNGEFLKDGTYEFKIFQPGTYIMADCSKKIYVESVGFDDTELYLRVGRSCSVEPIIYPFTATDKSIAFSSSRPQIATIDENGLIKGLKAGATIITAEALDGSGKKAKLLLYVTEK